MNKKTIAYSILMILCLALVAGCAQEQKKETIKVGAVLPMTGYAAYIGEELQEGILLAQKELQEMGINVEVVFEDSQGDAKTAVSIFNKFVDIDKPDIVITGSVVRPLIPLAEEAKLPLLATVASASDIPNQGDYIFRYFTNADIDAPVMAAYAVENVEMKTFGILHSNDEFGNSYANRFKQTVEARGGKVLADESYSFMDKDYRTQLLKIKANNADAIYLIGLDWHIVLMLQQMQELRMNQKVFAVGTIATENAIGQAGDAIEGVYVTAFCYSQLPEDYVQKFQAMHGKYPGYFTTFGYDSMKLIADAVDNKDITRENIKQGLLATNNFPGVVGDITSNAYGEMEFPICPKVIRNKQIIRLS
ncbi:MAG: penicillin-binding protein activator [Nanoarchaeota archaeon]|nr:penicillin-binding protein activator [Nanoarchaeota archaeon]